LKGFIETPPSVVDLMVKKLFEGRQVSAETRVLDAGAGRGPFIDGIIRWCVGRGLEVPRITCSELNPRHVKFVKERFRDFPSVEIKEEDFLATEHADYDYVISNPPYVPITQLSDMEKRMYRPLFKSARGRFDLYLLFFEHSIDALKEGGRLVFITPEKFLYVQTAKALRQILAKKTVEEVEMINENAFGELVTYPTITTVTNSRGRAETLVKLRDGRRVRVKLPMDGSSWLPHFRHVETARGHLKLADICDRITPGVATGADSVFVFETRMLDSTLKPFAFPTIAGRELDTTKGNFSLSHSMLIPYGEHGNLLAPDNLGALLSYLSSEKIRARLMKRTCVERKPWYAFHETPNLDEILRPKILCKDISKEPRFWVDREARIVPRHTVYYIVPKDPSRIDEIADYLNSAEAKEWLQANCQRAANGFLRIQSHVLKHLPIPQHLAAKAVILALP